MAQTKIIKARHLDKVLQKLKWQLRTISIRQGQNGPTRGILTGLYSLSAGKQAPDLYGSFNQSADKMRFVRHAIELVERNILAAERYSPKMA